MQIEQIEYTIYQHLYILMFLVFVGYIFVCIRPYTACELLTTVLNVNDSVPVLQENMMLGRKQSLKGEPVLADYGPEEVLNESADIEWVNMVIILLY